MKRTILVCAQTLLAIFVTAMWLHATPSLAGDAISSEGLPSPLTQLVAPGAAAHQGESGFFLLRDGETAFRVRNGMIRLAEQTLDVQYYIWEGDLAGRTLAQRLLEAARRGVRIRLLIDDIHTAGRDIHWSRLDAHPNIEVKVFNPFKGRTFRGLDWLLSVNRVNHRMHNKAMIADGAVAVVGGRNIGDDYFGMSGNANFRDLDVFATGPVVGDLRTAFDDYWSSEWAQHLTRITGKAPDPQEAEDAYQYLTNWLSGIRFPYQIDRSPEEMRTLLQQMLTQLVWAHARVYVDIPEKAAGDRSQLLVNKLREDIGKPGRDVLIEAAYLVPGKHFIEQMRESTEAGINVKILTNSLATNDVVAAHAGYADKRALLMNAGVSLHELRPDARSERNRWTSLAWNSRAALHTKTMVIDRERVFIGSLNFDPRSANINTELGIGIWSPQLAGQVAAFIEEGMQPANSYRLAIEDGEVVWHAADRTKPFRSEPESGWVKRGFATFLSWLPIDSQL